MSGPTSKVVVATALAEDNNFELDPAVAKHLRSLHGRLCVALGVSAFSGTKCFSHTNERAERLSPVTNVWPPHCCEPSELLERLRLDSSPHCRKISV